MRPQFLTGCRRALDDSEAYMVEIDDYDHVISDTPHTRITLLGRRIVVDIIDGHAYLIMYY